MSGSGGIETNECEAIKYLDLAAAIGVPRTGARAGVGRRRDAAARATSYRPPPRSRQVGSLLKEDSGRHQGDRTPGARALNHCSFSLSNGEMRDAPTRRKEVRPRSLPGREGADARSRTTRSRSERRYDLGRLWRRYDNIFAYTYGLGPREDIP